MELQVFDKLINELYYIHVWEVQSDKENRVCLVLKAASKIWVESNKPICSNSVWYLRLTEG